MRGVREGEGDDEDEVCAEDVLWAACRARGRPGPGGARQNPHSTTRIDEDAPGIP